MTQSRRRRLLMAAGSAALAPLPALHPRRVLAQAAVPRIVLVLPGNLRNMAMRTDAFQQHLRELGLVEGKTLIVEIRELGGKFDQLPALLAEIVKSRPQIILVQGSQSVKAAMQATSTIPIVALTMADPVEQGVAASLARPGGNVTGNALIETVADQKTVEILHEIVPAAKRIALLTDPTNPVYAFRQKRFPAAAGKRGLTPLLIHASRAEELPKAFDDAVRQRAQMLLVANDAFLGQMRAPSSISRQGTASRRSTPTRITSPSAAWWLTLTATPPCTATRPCLSTVSSRAASRPTCRSSNPRASS